MIDILCHPQGRNAISEQDLVQKILRESGITTLETGLTAALASGPCLAHAMCLHGASVSLTVNQGLSNALSHLTEFISAVKDTQEAVSAKTRSIDMVLGAVEVGRAIGAEACDSLYPCEEDEEEVQTSPSLARKVSNAVSTPQSFPRTPCLPPGV